jgi:hypothetical protein
MDEFGNELMVSNWKAALYFWFGDPSSEFSVANICWLYELH